MWTPYRAMVKGWLILGSRHGSKTTRLLFLALSKFITLLYYKWQTRGT